MVCKSAPSQFSVDKGVCNMMIHSTVLRYCNWILSSFEKSLNPISHNHMFKLAEEGYNEDQVYAC